VVTLDHAEIRQRSAARLGPVVDLDLLEALASLPHGKAAEWSSIDPVAQPTLDRAPIGVLDSDAWVVTRIWRPALSVQCVIVTSGDWPRGLSSVSLFAPDAPRALVVPRLPRRPARLLELAGRAGVGIVSLEDSPSLILRPSRPELRRPGPRHWRFLETVFARWLAERTYEE
jgi:hypothetical protein